MADWVIISSLATAGGTLVLAVATFSSVKSGNRSARVAERSLMAGLRPVLVPSKEEDPVEHVRFGDGVALAVPGHGGAVVQRDGSVYLAIALRNGGSGLAVLHAWRARPRDPPLRERPSRERDDVRLAGPPDLDDFRRQQLDIYVPAGDTGIWLGALRDPEEPGYREVREALEHGDAALQVDLMYGDHEGGQRTIARFVISPWPEEDDEPGPLEAVGELRPAGQMRAIVVRYWNVDGDDPR